MEITTEKIHRKIKIILKKEKMKKRIKNKKTLDFQR